MAKLVIETELETKQFEKQIQSLEYKLNDLKSGYEEFSTEKGFNEQSQQAIEFRKEIEKTTNSLNKLREQQRKLSLESVSNIQYNASSKLMGGLSLTRTSLGQYAKGIQSEDFEFVAKNVKDLKDAFPGLGEEAEKAGQRSGLGFEKGIKSLKRFGLALLGVRGMFTLVRRATSSYLSQHEETANKINSIWVALGNALGPIIEIIADGILKLVGYLNVFLQALGFDIDLTKNMNKSAKAIDGTTKAMKELNNQVYSFDEMNVQQKETSVGGIGIGDTSTTGGLKMPELNQDVVRFLQDTAKFLKDNYEWLLAIVGVVGGIKVAKWLSGLGSLIGGGAGTTAKGLLGLSNILYGLLALEAIAITISVIYIGMELNKLKKTNDEIERFYNNNTKNSKKVNDNNLEVARSYEKGSEAIDKYVYELNSQINSSRESINAKRKENNEMSITGQMLEGLTGTRKKNNVIIEEQTQRIIDNAKNLQILAQEGKLTDDQMKIYYETMGYLNRKQEELNKQLSINVGLFGEAPQKINSTSQKLYDQIKALRDNENQFNSTINNEKIKVSDLAKTISTQFSNISKLVAKPKVEVQANTNKIANTLQSLAKLDIFGMGENNIFYKTVSVLRKIGLAHGGIINNPGRGIVLSGITVGGEATGGAEGVVPLSDQEAMDRLGSSIAEHVVINFTNNTLLNNRVIAREQKKIGNSIDFVTNGRGA